ncbi:G2/M phase-specific E3 ubiquitin-protein ligase-like isoform X1 [Paramisgurnus dabryanus]|uniref:G2/M phase-specific E3 ubiquitin-protein ligase-like isoform X1 n=1 Tax=Paramisgurnus dabryanus TaxID=90735 RepID=UPI0031F370F2
MGSEDTEDWRTEPDLNRAAYIFRRSALQEMENQPDLVAKMNLLKSPEEREREILTFYKNPLTNWARPLSVVLGENCGKKLFFNGQEDHLVPSTSRLLLDSDLFRVIGRMIGHSFLHGGPFLTGLSQSLFNLLIGQKDEVAVVELEDCPDTDVTDIVSLLQGSGNLTEDERDQVNHLAISWDLPPVNENNRKWLAQSILYHAVIVRREKRIRQIRQGLKDTGVLCMIKERRDLIDVLFPRSSAKRITSEMILNRTIWPRVDIDDEEYGDYTLEDTCKMTVFFFREYIEKGTPEELIQLIQFWVGWGVLSQNLYVEVSSDVAMPTASTCRETIKLPVKYSTYESFQKDLKAAVSSTDSGFGLV